MSRTTFKIFSLRNLAVLSSLALLSGCGLTQRVADGTAETGRAIFYKQVKTLQLDFTPRSAANTDREALQDIALPTLVRVYQLRDDRTVLRTDYDTLLDQGHDRLASDLLDEHALVIRPEQGARLDLPLHPQAQFVAIVGLFRQPDPNSNDWRLVLSRAQLEPDQSRVIEVRDNKLYLRALPGQEP